MRDVDATASAWRALGVTNIRDGGVQELPGRGLSRHDRDRASEESVRALREWDDLDRAADEGTAYADFLARHGEGVQHVGFSCRPTRG